MQLDIYYNRLVPITSPNFTLGLLTRPFTGIVDVVCKVP